MAWIKVPPQHHPVFRAALPKDPRVDTKPMFGGVIARVNGNSFAGLFGLSAVVTLSEADRAAALALDGAELFDPMGNGRVMSDKVMLPEDVFHDDEELRAWIARAFEFAASLPRKLRGATAKQAAVEKPAAKKPADKPNAAKRVAAKPTAARSAAKPAAKSAAKKSAAKTSTAAKSAARRRAARSGSARSAAWR